jgi:hypothetical protein
MRCPPNLGQDDRQHPGEDRRVLARLRLQVYRRPMRQLGTSRIDDDQLETTINPAL